MRDRELQAELASLRAALAAEQAKEIGFAHLSHELRTLVSGITGLTGLLLDTELSTEQRDYGKRLRGLSESLGDLLNTVLDWSRAEAGKLELAPVDLDVRRVVEDVGELLAERAQDKGLELVILVASDVPAALRGDAVRLRQVIVNLVSNALKFTERGEVVVRALLAGAAPGEVVVRFEVQDTGVGISTEKQARLFQPFSQVHEGAARGGSGLGLALARQIVEAMGGEIGVESRGGAGCRFHFTARFPRRASSHERGTIPRVDVAGRRVLSAVPSAAMRASLAGMIADLGLEDGAAATGEAAAEALRAAVRAGQPYDVALLDVGLPGVTELFQAIDSDPALLGLPVVLLAYPGQRLPEDDRLQVRPAGLGPPTTGTGTSRGSPRGAVRPVSHLAKPVRRGQLFATLRTLLGGALETIVSGDTLRLDAAPESRRSSSVSARSWTRTDDGGQGPVSQRASRPGMPAVPDPAGSSPRAVSVSFLSPVGKGSAGSPASAAPTPASRVGEPAPVEAPPRAVDAALPAERPLILLVEDNAVNQRIGQVMMEKRGYDVDVASDGYEAIALTARATYAAVLMDCQMPRLDGYAATREIRLRDAGKPRLPIIAMTANAGPGARERCLAAGMDDYVAKPVTPERLDELLRRWVPLPGRAPLEAPAPRRPSVPVVDLGMLHQLRVTQKPGEPDIVAEVVAIFLDDAPARLRQIREALGADDLLTASRTVHTLKGAAGHLGARTLVAMCARFEEKVRTSAPFNAAFAVDAIEDELAKVRTALGEEMKKGA
jgi:CheY-like chemotaxis protein/nitrogen-specific signal transduction histidine kinase